jgi:hypothetical protein
MKNDFDHISIEFHNRANQALVALYSDFKCAVTAIDRQGDENVFQQLHLKFAGRLKQQLQEIAREILGQMYDGSYSNETSQVLSRSIEDYVHEFMQRVRAL